MSSLLFFQEFTLSILRHRRQLRRQLRRHNHLRICSCFVISISLPHLTLKPSHLRRSTGEAAKESIDKKDDFLCFSGSILLFESSVLFFTSSFCCILISSEDRSLLEIDLLLFITLDRFYLFFASSCHLCHEVSLTWNIPWRASLSTHTAFDFERNSGFFEDRVNHS